MNAASYIVRARTAFQLPSYKTILWDENISFVSTEQTTNIPSMVADSQVSRVSMDTILSTTLSSTEYAGYIKTAEIQAPELGIDDVFGDI
ncbi:MAG: hypothetical protein GY841_24175 [FCB group bacterium]|nr:hypothetical protein [FCB group bacterium]